MVLCQTGILVACQTEKAGPLLTLTLLLGMETSDHMPCVVSISTSIPARRIFRFENYWMEHQNFMSIVQQGWVRCPSFSDAAKIITAKFKYLTRMLKEWQSTLSNLKVAICNVKLTFSFLLFIEEFRDLTLPEWNFKSLLEQKLYHPFSSTAHLLETKGVY